MAPQYVPSKRYIAGRESIPKVNGRSMVMASSPVQARQRSQYNARGHGRTIIITMFVTVNIPANNSNTTSLSLRQTYSQQELENRIH